MNEQEIREVKAASNEARIRFPEVVARLTRAGVERYVVDYARGAATYYGVAGEVLDLPQPAPHVIADAFDAAGVEAAVRASQRGEIFFPEFVRRTCAAGTVSYLVTIVGRRAVYYGRRGEAHEERFPGGPAI